MLVSSKNNIGLRVIIIAIRLFIGYVRYFFLTASVLLLLATSLFVLLSINPNFSFGFVKYLSFINPLFGEESFSMGTKEAMEIFSVVALFLWIIVGMAKFIFKKIFAININISVKIKSFILFAVISLIYIIALIIVILDNALDGEFYFIFIIFYIINIISAMWYLSLGALLDRLDRIFNSLKNIEA